ncbi:hypothetical protein FYJ24_09310 [Actinomycetaceae bacterium WB03_NA08]|uniref:Uncharacterized protein n=1 Tax=Scrofimicrobium canadense TaxID=2652290 RepID=A0A6N7W9M2_9ACTO|nr:hypothetical protein [Scrofimicrobium canadense]MSS84956.1 hypothetical protein [Scrofimicrobium canadense]
MSEAGIIAITSAILAFVGGSGGLVAWLRYKTEKQKNYVDQALAGFQALLEAEQNRRKELADRVTLLEAEAFTREGELSAEREYTHLLEDHINARLPPPPPPRPQTT